MLTRVVGAAFVCGMFAAAFPAQAADDWPNRSVKVEVPYGVGGVTDVMARLTADRLSKTFGRPFIIENKPGAGGAIGVESALLQPRDGYTILFVGSTLFTVLPLVRKVAYVPMKDLVPISITGSNPMVLVVKADSRFKTLRDLIDDAKANPGKVTYSSGGASTNNHLDTAYMAGLGGLDMVHVPFTGGQQAVTAVLSNQVDFHFGNSSDVIEPVNNGSMRALAVSGPRRMSQLPDVPTVAETLPGYEYVAWNGYAVTGGTPQDVIDKLSRALANIAKDPEVVRIFTSLGIDSVGGTPAEAGASLDKDFGIYSKIVDMADVRAK